MSQPDRKLINLRGFLYGTSLRRTLVRCLILAVVSVVVFKFVFIPVRVNGGSMLPTYSDRTLNLVNRLAYKHHPPRRGDVVALWMSEKGRSFVLMKRIVGLPGEAIGFRNGRVTVNGRALDEPYVTFYSDWNSEPIVCGPGQYYFVGDNRSMPMKDHDNGLTDARLIVGKMLL